MNKRYWLVIQTVLALILTAVLFTGCGQGQGGITSKSGMLTEIIMTTAVDADGRAQQPTTVFTTTAGGFFCSFKVVDAPSDTEVKGEWVYVSGEMEEQIGGKNYVMDWMTVLVEGTHYSCVYYLRPPVPGYEWPQGEYKVVLYVDGEEDASLPFTVTAQGADSPGDVNGSTVGSISDVTIATAVDSKDRPIHPETVFPTDTEKFYCSFKVSGFPYGTRIGVEWIYVGGEAAEEVGENTVFQQNSGTLGGDDGYTAIELPMPDYPDYKWPKGDYKVVLYVEGVEMTSTSYKVE